MLVVKKLLAVAGKTIVDISRVTSGYLIVIVNSMAITIGIVDLVY